ncbi:MAG: hypothetical protein PHO30_05455 [Candidatus Omnitrophica bacterium]|nr:hypothetical protein [Candidatus Omnitrophota bacterium]
MQKPENVAQIAESAMILFGFFFILFSWPFLSNIDNQSPQFLFAYFFIAWLVSIFFLFRMTRRYHSSGSDSDKKAG